MNFHNGTHHSDVIIFRAVTERMALTQVSKQVARRSDKNKSVSTVPGRVQWSALSVEATYGIRVPDNYTESNKLVETF
jgi:hypothetical protein